MGEITFPDKIMNETSEQLRAEKMLFFALVTMRRSEEFDRDDWHPLACMVDKTPSLEEVTSIIEQHFTII